MQRLVSPFVGDLRGIAVANDERRFATIPETLPGANARCKYLQERKRTKLHGTESPKAPLASTCGRRRINVTRERATRKPQRELAGTESEKAGRKAKMREPNARQVLAENKQNAKAKLK